MPRYCPVCSSEVHNEPLLASPYQPAYDCGVCGKFKISEYVANDEAILWRLSGPRPDPMPNHHLISGEIREMYESSGEQVFIADRSIFHPTPRFIDPFESTDRILRYAKRRSSRIGQSVRIDTQTDYPIAFARDAAEMNNLLYFAEEVGYAEIVGGLEFRIKPQGWQRLRQLQEESVDPNSAFVAMNFATELNDAYDNGIRAALLATGYSVIRVDRVQHNGKIDDLVIADIRRSSLIVGDFTNHRQNVYFEVGFALGLHRNVIWTCRRSDINAAHFDTRQYNHIVWDTAEDLKTKLESRIVATIPGRV